MYQPPLPIQYIQTALRIAGNGGGRRKHAVLFHGDGAAAEGEQQVPVHVVFKDQAGGGYRIYLPVRSDTDIHKILLVLHVGRQQVQPGNVMLLYGVPLCRLRDTV